MRRVKRLIFICLTVISFVLSGVEAQTPPPLTESITSLNHSACDLPMMIFWICAGISFLVLLMMLSVMIYHRKTQGAKAVHFHAHFFSELLWTAIPLLILLAMAIPAIQVLFQARQADPVVITTQTKGN